MGDQNSIYYASRMPSTHQVFTANCGASGNTIPISQLFINAVYILLSCSVIDYIPMLPT